MSILGLGTSVLNTLSIGQEVAQRRNQVSAAASLLEQTHQEMINMAANSFSLEEAQKVRSLPIVIEALAQTANIMSEIGTRERVMAQCLYRASLDVENIRMLLRDLTHHHLPPLLATEINERLPEGIRIIPKQNVQLIESPTLEVTKYALNIGVSMTIYTGTPIPDLHEYHYIGHAIGLTTVPEKMPTNGSHVVKSVCFTDDLALICQSPIEWMSIDEWADQTPQRFTDKTWSAMTPAGDVCVNTPTLTYANRTCAYDRPGCYTSNSTSAWRAPHGVLVPPIKVDYMINASITAPQSPADEELAAELRQIIRELNDKVKAQDKKRTAILNTHHALTKGVIARATVLKENAHRLVVQVENERWWDMFTIDTTPMGIVRMCVAVLIFSVPLLWLCNVILLACECRTMRQRTARAYVAPPGLTMTQFQQGAICTSRVPRGAVIEIDAAQTQQLRAWVKELQLPLEARRHVATASLPAGVTPHIRLAAVEDSPTREWMTLNLGAVGRRVALRSTELHITPKGMALLFDERTQPLADLFRHKGHVPACVLTLAPGRSVESVLNLVRNNDELPRQNTAFDALTTVGPDCYACECEQMFDGVVALNVVTNCLVDA